MSNPGKGVNLVEKYNQNKIEASLTNLNTKFASFADNCEEVITYINDNVKPQGNLYGVGAAELLKVWIPNIGSAKSFIDNFENWLTYVRLELQELKTMDDELQSNLDKMIAANNGKGE
jgi:hypothetical protein